MSCRVAGKHNDVASVCLLLVFSLYFWGVATAPAQGQSSNAITIQSPSTYQVFQRSGSNTGDIVISGTYKGAPKAIEAQWKNGAWAVIATRPGGGRYSGVLSGRPAGQGTLKVRFSNRTSVTAIKQDIGIGDIFVIVGQSNASGRGVANQTYSHSSLRAAMFGNNDQWQNLADPVDSSSGQVDAVSNDGKKPRGSLWPLLATRYLAHQKVPVAFIPAAVGGSTILQWQRNSASSFPLNLYGSMTRRIRAVGGKVRAVLFWQGESDTKAGVSQSDYKAGLESFASSVLHDFGVKTVVAQSGGLAGVAAANLDAIRSAQSAAWSTVPQVVAGPSLYDVNVSDEGGDGTHLSSGADLLTGANRWWAALHAAFYNGPDGRGPRLSAATLNASKTEVTLTFVDKSLPLLSTSGGGGFTVENGDGTPRAVSSAGRIADDKIKIVLASPAAATAIRVSLGKGHSGTGARVPMDTSTYRLPAEIFLDVPVAVSSGSPSLSMENRGGAASLAVAGQPDVQIRKLDGNRFRGADIYNLDGADQSQSQIVSAGTATYILKVQNDGTLAGNFRISGTGDSSGWEVKYFDASTGGNEITSQVMGEGWTTALLAPGDSSELRLVVKADAVAPASLSKDVAVTATSTGDARDTVRAITSASSSPASATANGRAVSRAASVSPSIATAEAGTSLIRLRFNQALDGAVAADASHYRVEVNGVAVAVEGVSYSVGGSTVTIAVAEGTLQAGNQVMVWWEDLLGADGNSFSGQAGPFIAR